MTSAGRLTLTLALGIGAGLAYAASPATAWSLAVMGVLFWWVGRGLGARERRVVWTVLAVAVAVRLAAIAAMFLSTPHDRSASFFWDGDGAYLKQRAGWIRDLWSGMSLHPTEIWEAYHPTYGWTTYIYVLAYVQYLLGPSPYGVHLVTVILSLGACVLLYGAARAAYGRETALLGFVLTMFLPTLFAWSVSALKESLYIFLGTVAIAATLAAFRARGLVTRLTAVAVVIAAVAANNTVRAGALQITLAGVAAGVAAAVVVRKPLTLVAALIVVPVVTIGIWNNAGMQTRVMDGVRRAAVVHLGYVNSGGNVYHLLDRRLYNLAETTTMTPAEGMRFGLRAIGSVVAVPLPWQVRSRSELAFLPQQVVWYVLVLLAVPGFLVGLRRDAVFTGSLAGVVIASGVVIGFTSGNVGTMVRLRDTLLPYLLWMSSLGAVTCASWCISRAARLSDTGIFGVAPLARRALEG